MEEVRRRLLGLLLLLLELLRMKKVRREEGLRVGMKLVRMGVHERSVLLLLLLVRRRQLVLASGVAFPRISRRLQQIEERRAGCVAAVWVLCGTGSDNTLYLTTAAAHVPVATPARA
jgi:hypothetical protein